MNPAVLQCSVSKHFRAQSAGEDAGTSLVMLSFGRLATGITWNSTRPSHLELTPGKRKEFMELERRRNLDEEEQHRIGLRVHQRKMR